MPLFHWATRFLWCMEGSLINRSKPSTCVVCPVNFSCSSLIQRGNLARIRYKTDRAALRGVSQYLAILPTSASSFKHFFYSCLSLVSRLPLVYVNIKKVSRSFSFRIGLHRSTTLLPNDFQYRGIHRRSPLDGRPSSITMLFTQRHRH